MQYSACREGEATQYRAAFRPSVEFRGGGRSLASDGPKQAFQDVCPTLLLLTTIYRVATLGLSQASSRRYSFPRASVVYPAFGGQMGTLQTFMPCESVPRNSAAISYSILIWGTHRTHRTDYFGCAHGKKRIAHSHGREGVELKICPICPPLRKNPGQAPGFMGDTSIFNPSLSVPLSMDASPDRRWKATPAHTCNQCRQGFYLLRGCFQRGFTAPAFIPQLQPELVGLLLCESAPPFHVAFLHLHRPRLLPTGKAAPAPAVGFGPPEAAAARACNCRRVISRHIHEAPDPAVLVAASAQAGSPASTRSTSALPSDSDPA